MSFKDYIKFILKAVYPFAMAIVACLAGVKYSVLAMDIFSGGFFDPIKTFEKEKNKPFKYDSTFNPSSSAKLDSLEMPLKDGLANLNKIDNQTPPATQTQESLPSAVNSGTQDASTATEQAAPVDAASNNISPLGMNINLASNQASGQTVQEGTTVNIANATNIQPQPSQAQQQKGAQIAQNSNQLKLIQNYKKNEQTLQQGSQNINSETSAASFNAKTNVEIVQNQIKQPEGVAAQQGQGAVYSANNQNISQQNIQPPAVNQGIQSAQNVQLSQNNSSVATAQNVNISNQTTNEGNQKLKLKMASFPKKNKGRKFKKLQAEIKTEQDDIEEEEEGEEEEGTEINENSEPEPRAVENLPRKKKFNKRFYKKNYKKRYRKNIK